MIRCTELLKHFGLYGERTVDTYYLERGTYIHQMVELYDRGTLDEDNLDETLQKYLVQYKRFKDAAKYLIIESEQRYESKTLGVTGQIDLICTKHNDTHKHKYLLDIKTGDTDFAAYQIQTAIYTLIYPFKIHKRGCLHLTQGKWFITWHTDQNDFIVARSLINVYNYQVKQGLIKKDSILPPSYPFSSNNEGGAMSPSQNKE